MAEEFAITEAKRVVDTIVQTIYQGEPSSSASWQWTSAPSFGPSEIIKAGSLGHGTAVPGHYDLDLVVYSRDIDPDKVLKNGFDYWLRILEEFLDRKFPWKLTDKEANAFSRQFKFDGKIDVDMLVSPYWAHPKDLYDFFKRIPQSKRYSFSVSASKWQVEFFSSKPNQVKEFIKRAKAWRNWMWEGSKVGKPKSFLMSVIVLRAYENAQAKLGYHASTKSMAKETTQQIKHIVKNHRNADIYWEHFYKVHDYRDLFPSYLPRIVDPANPSNNLHETGISGASNKRGGDYGEGGGAWDNFVRFVDTLDLTQTVEEIQSAAAAHGTGYYSYKY